ncbi:MAG: DnaJ domain-containing protein [Gammaproteobacteria bacterium]|nr:DnaJ domain-containing protein [Gammaproteobacteria bacterium]
MVIIICGVLAAFAFLLLMKVLWTKAKPKLSTNVIVITSLVFLGSLGLLAASGRMHWVAATGTAVLPFLRRAFTLFRFGSFATRMWQQFGSTSPFSQAFGEYNDTDSNQAPNVSETTTDEIRMTLEHTSGKMTGTVLEGKFANRSLESLDEMEIVELYNYVSDESKRLLTAYIQRYHPNLGAQSSEESNSGNEGSSDTITPERARKILGVAESATRDEIIEAHRRLMQKNHPDRGGSEYIASEINQAKRVLLNLL